jgi:acyl-CoA thioesterase FadM
MLQGEEARVYIRLKQLGKTSMTIEHKIVRPPKDGKSGAVCYRGTATLVSFDHEKQVKRAITPALRLAIERVEQRVQVRPIRPASGVCKL